MKSWTVALVALIAACAHHVPCPACPTCPAVPAPSSTAIAFGETFRLSSAVLGEQRVINVYLPPDYARGEARVPVLFALDGGMHEDFPHIAGVIDVSIRNEVIRPLVVVGIENTERRRDLVSATSIDEER